MEMTEKFADFTVSARYSEIPPRAIDNAKRAILDGLGVILAGSTEQEGRLIAEYVRDSGCRPEASVYGYNFKTSASLATLANGTMAHAMDYDDGAVGWAFHATAVLLPPILALGEAHHISGREALECYAVGFEVAGRLGTSTNAQLASSGWHQTGVMGTMATAALSARILGLDRKQIRNALGIAASFAGGIRGNFGTMTKPLHAGNAGRNGIIAAELALKGITANESILEDEQGFMKAFCGLVGDDLKPMTDSLANPLLLASPGTIVKIYPACRGTHRCIDAALYLKRRHHLSAEDIAEVECATSETIRTSLIYSRPETPLQAKFCLEYCVARALLNGEVSVAHFTDEAITEPDVQRLAARVKYRHPEELRGWAGRELPETVTVKLKDGRQYQHSVDKATGAPENPPGEGECLAKYRQCAGLVLSKESIERSVQMVANLEQVKDISALAKLMVP